MAETPYTGLMPFREDQAPFFFGRDAEREIITANLMASRLTLLYGPSGVGKSSVINAGVVHHLRQRARDRARRHDEHGLVVSVFFTWRDDPLETIEQAIADGLPAGQRNGTFTERLHAWNERTGSELFIILDQFEEYFLYHDQEDGEGTFATEFPRAVNRPDLRVSFLVSLREDSLAKLDRFKGRIPNLFANYVRIDHLDRDAARDAITKPIEKYNQIHADASPITIEPALVDKVLEQVQAGRVVVGEAGLGFVTSGTDDANTRRIETPYLQLVMTRLWEEETKKGSLVLRTGTLDDLGGAEQIVKTHVDATMQALLPEEKDAAANVFNYLVTPSRTKIAHTARDLANYTGLDEPTLKSLLQTLSSGENRILTTVAPASDQPTHMRYQIFHDVLASAVLDWRTRYVQAQRRAQAEARAREEQAAAEARTDEQRRRAEQEARNASRLRMLSAGLIVVLLAAIAFAIVAVLQSRRAREGQRQAQLSSLREDEAKHNAQAAGLELVSSVRARNEAEQRAEASRLDAEAARAELRGAQESAQRLRAQADAARSKAADERRASLGYSSDAKNERDAADKARQQRAALEQQGVPSAAGKGTASQGQASQAAAPPGFDVASSDSRPTAATPVPTPPAAVTATPEPPAAVAGPSATPPPSAAPAPDLAVEAMDGVRRALERYAAAYSHRSVDELLRVYPAFPRAQDLRKALDDFVEYEMTVVPGRVQLMPDRSAAVVTCTVSARFRPKAGKETGQPPQTRTFRLRKQGAEWVITGVEAGASAA